MAIYQSVYPDPLTRHEPFVVFDGDCAFCTAGISWIAKKLTPGEPVCSLDGTHAFETNPSMGAPDPTGASAGEKIWPRFVALSACPNSIRQEFESIAHADSIWVWHQGVLYDQSDAALFLFGLMETPYRFLTIGRIVPRILRDALYRLVAKYRNKLAR